MKRITIKTELENGLEGSLQSPILGKALQD